ncbi:hypothetical protein HFP05_10020 [Rhodanobacter denitrificans]|nr:hypothetical protein [Rhodanobacter denitrificans]
MKPQPDQPVATARQLPSFWLTMLIGWVPIVLGTVTAAATVLGEPDKLAQHAMLLATCLLPSIPLCLIQRSLWRRRASWRRYVAVLLPLSFLLAFAGTAGIMAWPPDWAVMPARCVAGFAGVSSSAAWTSSGSCCSRCAPPTW